jgi:hypothetical protein
MAILVVVVITRVRLDFPPSFLVYSPSQDQRQDKTRQKTKDKFVVMVRVVVMVRARLPAIIHIEKETNSTIHVSYGDGDWFSRLTFCIIVSLHNKNTNSQFTESLVILEKVTDEKPEENVIV